MPLINSLLFWAGTVGVAAGAAYTVGQHVGHRSGHECEAENVKKSLRGMAIVPVSLMQMLASGRAQLVGFEHINPNWTAEDDEAVATETSKENPEHGE